MIKKAKRAWMLYWVSALWVFFFTANSLVGTFLTATYHMDFFALTHHEQVMIGLGVFLSWSTVMMALLTNLAKRIEKGQPIVLGDDGPPNPLPINPVPTAPQPESKQA